MNRYAISNIALSPYDHIDELSFLGELGLCGLEIAPSRRWHQTWHGLRYADVRKYRQHIENAGLSVVGLHSLFFDHPELGLFKGDNVFAETVSFMRHLSGVCSDLGGRTLVWGGGRRRGNVHPKQATKELCHLVDQILPDLERDGTCLCFEPLGSRDTDFLNSVFEILPLVKKYNSSGLRIQLDAKALVENNEACAETFESAKDYLVHFHANEPNLDLIGSSGTVPHSDFANLLRSVEYEGFISIEQIMSNSENHKKAIEKSVFRLKNYYENNN